MAQTTRSDGKKTTSGSRSTTKKTPAKKNSKTQGIKPIRREIGAIVCLFFGLFSLIGYFSVDAWFITFFCGLIKSLIGWGYYIFPPALLLCAVTLTFHRGRPVIFRVVASMMMPLLVGMLLHLILSGSTYEFGSGIMKLLFDSGKVMTSGGVVAGLLAMLLKSALSIYGAVPMVIFALVFFTVFAVGLTPKKIVEYFKNREVIEYEPEEEAPDMAPVRQAAPAPARGRRARKTAIDIPVDDSPEEEAEYVEERVGFFNTRPRVKTPDQLFVGEDYIDSVEATVDAAGAADDILTQSFADPPSAAEGRRKIARSEVNAETAGISQTIESEKAAQKPAYQFPPLTLLNSGARSSTGGREEMAMNRERLESTLHSFGVSGTITDITRGPTVTRYDLELDAGVKLNKITNLAGDLALSLGVTSVRIAPITDKISTVGIEVPNKLVSIVYLRDIIESAAFKNAQSELSFAIGEDIGGGSIVGNIAKLPHMLIAGTTGSGKSVCMNSLILSLLYKATPDEVRLIMIDPKMVELGIYNGIPHLYIPVVTDPKKAAGSLQWAVVEMLKRYRLFSEVGVRDITGYNRHLRNVGEPVIPQVVIVIDELADLMLVASKEVEESICRVAQMGRASGMHLIIATQRPSAEVITGLMKANIPSRIAFAVSSAMESRIILDAQGAEKLVGSGDMLYSPLGSGKPMRIQGAFVTDEERERVIDFVKTQAEAQYSEEIMAQIEQTAAEKESGSKSDTADVKSDYDEMLPQAVEVILETKQASVSMLQRRLKLGYSRAARIVDQMEEMGIVGPFEGSKPRQLLVTREQWQEMQFFNGTAPIDVGVHPDMFGDETDYDE